MSRPLPITRPTGPPKGHGALPQGTTHPGKGQGHVPSFAEQIKEIRARRDKKANQAPAKGTHPVNKGRTAKQKKNDRKPLFPGGITTRGEFRRGERAAENEQFRPQEQQVNDTASAIPSWYQDYLAKLQGLQTQTVEQYKGLQGQAGSLNEPVQGSNNEEATAATDARNNITKALQASLIQQQGSQLSKLGTYGAIATARKSQKEDEVAKARKEIATQRGEFRSKYTVEGKQREFENALAAKEFHLKRKETNAGIKANKDAAKNAETTYDKEFTKQAIKYGFSPHDWALLGHKGRAKRIAEEQRRTGAHPESLGRIQKKEEIKIAAKHGYTVSEWNKLSQQQRAAIIRKESGKAKDNKDKGTELTFRTGAQRGEVASGAVKAKSFAEKLKRGEGIPKVNKHGHKRLRPEAANLLLGADNAPEPAVASAVLDAVYLGFISRDTARRLHSSELKVDELARALGVPTYGEHQKAVTRKQRAAIRKNSGIYRRGRAPQPQGHY